MTNTTASNINLELEKKIYAANEDNTGDLGKTDIPLDIPTIDPTNIDSLYEKAKQHVKNTKIGEFVKYSRPFTKQIFCDFRELYPDLNPFFKHADDIRKKTIQMALVMRATTLLLFSIYAAFLFYILRGDVESFLIQLTPLIIPLTVILLRFAGKSQIQNFSGKFGSSFSKRLSLIHNKGVYAIEEVDNDASSSDGCDIRAEKWTQIALWLFELKSFYDRYVTTTSWKVHTSFVDITWAFRVAKWIIVATFFLLILTPLSSKSIQLPDHLWLIILYGIGVLAWDIFPGQGAANSLFADSFIDAVKDRSEEEIWGNHVNTKISKLVGNLRQTNYGLVGRTGGSPNK